MLFNIALINQSTVVSDSEAAAAASALNYQLRHHFYNAWKIVCGLTFIPKGQTVPNGYWPMYILDESDVQGALGYHEFATNGPQAKVFAKTCQRDNVTWTSCASHEALEMTVDPGGSLAALNDSTGVFYTYEVCDAAEEKGYFIQLKGQSKVEVSDFVLPSWFVSDGKGPYNFLNTLKAPFSLLQGGYTETLNVSQTPGWQQITARARQRYHIKSNDKN